MAQNKSQLPMIRSLKTIARRQMNQQYSSVTVSAAVQERLKQAALSNKKERARVLRALTRAQTKTLLVAYAMSRNEGKLTPDEKTAVEEFERQMSHHLDPIPDTSVWGLIREYQKDVVERARLLFNDLEGLELRIIAGEEVDLAPYARQLQTA